MQKEIDHLKKKLCHARRRRTPSFSDPSSEDSQGSSCRHRSRTPHSETFSYEEDDLCGHKGRTGSCPTRVMLVSQNLARESHFEPKRIKGSTPPILGFSKEDNIGTIQQHDDVLVVTLRIGGYDVRRVMVDQGSGADIMYPNLFKGLNFKLEDLTAYDSPLISFEGKAVIPKGQIRLPMQSSPEVLDVDFIVVDAYSPYTAILARCWLHALGAVSSTIHVKQSMSSATPKIAEVEGHACEELERVLINDDPEKFFQVGIQLPPLKKEELVTFFKRNMDVFAWNAYEAPRVDPNFICHHLNVNPSVLPRRQPPRRSSKEHTEAVKEEVCPKDSLSMPRIDQLVDATVGHPQMRFLEAFQGYHQIPLALEDQEKTAFVTPIGNYYYKVMHFSLKNQGLPIKE
ncbi:uncharacterized protein LOC142644209 [Castanea sativa]|uniref:uncharacterized protein LOC142644209 n=1 Tax=Castanea sativa TaxID=21020 RepID=UPI003F653BF5